MKKITYYIIGAVLILSMILFYRVRKADRKIKEISDYLDMRDSEILAKHNLYKMNEISKIDATRIKVARFEKINEYPYYLIEIDELIFNPEKYNLKEHRFNKYYCTKDTFNYQFFEFNQETQVYENINRRAINGPINSIKIIKAGEDPVTAQDIRNRK
jgi:hypothetical protein